MNSDRRQYIYQSVLKYVYLHGISNVSTLEVAKQASVAEGLVFYYFKNKQNLLDECAIIYDRQLMAQCEQLAQEGKGMSEVWDIIYNHIIEHPEGAVYYFSYVNYYGFNPTENNHRAKEYLKVARLLFKGKENLNDHQILILWDHITTQLFYYANKMIRHELEDTIDERANVKRIAFLVYDNF